MADIKLGRFRTSNTMLKSWRLLIVVALVIGFSGPWFGFFGDVVNGLFLTRFLVANYMGHGVRAFLDLFVQPEHFWIDATPFLLAVGLVSTMIYWGVSLSRVFLRDKRWLAVLAAALLAGGIVGLTVETLFLAQYAYGGLSRCFWAYWLVLACLGSSAVLEFVVFSNQVHFFVKGSVSS